MRRQRTTNNGPSLFDHLPGWASEPAKPSRKRSPSPAPPNGRKRPGGRDPSLSAGESRRIAPLCRKTLDALMAGRKLNSTLARISLKYTCRISELRKLGYDIRAVKRKGPLTLDALIENGRQVRGYLEDEL